MKLRNHLRYYAHTRVPYLRGWFRYFGCTVYCPQASHLFLRVCESGIYEPEINELIRTFMPADGLLYDVGANIGLTAIAALHLRPRCTVISFEPSPNSIGFLRRTHHHHPSRNRWKLVEAMVTDRGGDSQFALSSASSGAFDGQLPTGRVEQVAQVTVKATTLDDYWTSAGAPKVDCIKIDVEGGESGVISGAKQCIATCRPTIVTEWSRDNILAYSIEYDRLLAIGREHSYCIYTSPGLNRVETTTDLKVAAATQVENFLLLPK